MVFYKICWSYFAPPPLGWAIMCIAWWMFLDKPWTSALPGTVIFLYWYNLLDELDYTLMTYCHTWPQVSNFNVNGSYLCVCDWNSFFLFANTVGEDHDILSLRQGDLLCRCFLSVGPLSRRSVCPRFCIKKEILRVQVASCLIHCLLQFTSPRDY